MASPLACSTTDDLYQLACDGDVRGCEALLSGPCAVPMHELDFPDPLSGVTPLSAACIYGHAEVTRALLSAGADPEKQLSNGMTALHWTATTGHTSCLLTLLQKMG